MGMPLTSDSDVGSILQYVSEANREAVERLLAAEASDVPDTPKNAPATFYSVPGGGLGKVGDNVWSTLWCRVPDEYYRRLILHCDDTGFWCEFQRYVFSEPASEVIPIPETPKLPLPKVELVIVESKKRANFGAGLYAYVPKRFKWKRKGTDDRVMSVASKARSSKPLRWSANAIGRKPS